MDQVTQKLLLAGLLHDIGKFYQRADNKLFKDSLKNPDNEIGPVSFNLAQSICPPTENGKFGYHHVVWTSQFFEDSVIKKKLEDVPGLKGNIWAEDQTDAVVNLACNHHMPHSALQDVVRLADWWSAGIDRTKSDTFETELKPDDPIQWGKNRYKSIPLFSIFNRLNKGNNQYGNLLMPLSIKRESIFPKPIQNQNDGLNQEKYFVLWKQFKDEFIQLPSDSFNGFFNSLFFLLKKYTWAIPSNTNDMADVSLFEHLKTSAAFAFCLHKYYEQKYTRDLTDLSAVINLNDLPVLMVGGDLSGIQNFIYNIASSKASKSLKGRSFYLQLLTDSIIHKIISHPLVDASLVNVIYASGGKFFLILPNLETVKSALEEIHKEIETELWNEHHGIIGFSLSFLPFAYQNIRLPDNKRFSQLVCEDSNGEMTPVKIGQLWKMLAEKLILEKDKPFKRMILNNYDEFFNEKNPSLQSGGKVKTCAVTGVELQGNYREIDIDVYVTKAVFEQTELGQALKDADYLITYNGKESISNYLNNRAQAKISVIGVDHYLFDQTELTKDDANFRDISSVDVSNVYHINDTNFLITLKGKGTAYGYRFYGGNQQAYHRDAYGNIKTNTRGKGAVKLEKTFEDLTKYDPIHNPDKETYLGFLRMDVDNLGKLFISGLPESSQSFAAYATLSFQLDLFFSGYLNSLRNEDAFADWVNILYAGGDDVFAIGRWDKLIDFATRLRNEFEAFTGRKDLSISGGMAIVNHKFPIAKAAELADEAEKASKKFKINNEISKNAFTFFGETVSWEGEMKEVEQWKDKLTALICEMDVPKSLLQRLMIYGQANKNYQSNLITQPSKADLSFKWNAAYNLKRFADKLKNEDAKKEVRQLQTTLFTANSRTYDLIALAARWAELKIRMR